MEELDIMVYDTPNPNLTDKIQLMLLSFNTEQLGVVADQKYKPLNIVVKYGDNVVGGIIAHTAWKCLTIKTMAIDSGLRKMGVGKAILDEAISEAKARGCTQAYVDSFSFQGHEFYLKQGFEIIGKQEDFPPGHSRYFLQKKI